MNRMNVQSTTELISILWRPAAASRARLLAPALALALAACGGGGGLSSADVEDIPPGTAVGSAASGFYDLELYTVACSGQCEVRNNGLTGSACEVGNVDTATVQVTQLDGTLRMDADGLIYDRLSGAIDADGSFIVGSRVTANGGAVEAIVLANGAVSAAGFAGTAEQRARGSNDGLAFDCTAEFEMTGIRLD